MSVHADAAVHLDGSAEVCLGMLRIGDLLSHRRSADVTVSEYLASLQTMPIPRLRAEIEPT
jgi:hypothetical protein